MAVFNHQAFFDAARSRVFGGKLSQAQVDGLNAALNVGFGISSVGRAPASAVPWLVEANKDMGLAEIPGVKHAPRILKMLVMLRYPFSDDETPWCGTAMAAWMKQAAIEPPAAGYRALNWASWGVACSPQVGAIGVKKRPEGNHVFLIVGETADKRYFKALGANQSNAVNIQDVLKEQAFAIRWPAGVPVAGIPLPVMPAGKISKAEA
ncbi:TIGR02594 family protein [Sphingomonas sp. KC8]|uniref:TIGR02594 family protein n=1 Tax=Sphingomonas sp. KC8 TaxID=1030157 RepID=UPI000248A43D|nr:TIGR02594 family protein [Sphingomonas sp. KC8]ARS27605.1 hypothetical protein KC8_09905 [Sphingomonas sp. KC8]